MTDESVAIPTENPLGVKGWPHEHYPDVDSRLLELAALTSGIDAVARVLANNGRLAGDYQDDPESCSVKPLDGFLTGGLQSALSALTFRAFAIAWDWVEKEQKRHDLEEAQV
jgi:hypothetical protein